MTIWMPPVDDFEPDGIWDFSFPRVGPFRLSVTAQAEQFANALAHIRPTFDLPSGGFTGGDSVDVDAVRAALEALDLPDGPGETGGAFPGISGGSTLGQTLPGGAVLSDSPGTGPVAFPEVPVGEEGLQQSNPFTDPIAPPFVPELLPEWPTASQRIPGTNTVGAPSFETDAQGDPSGAGQVPGTTGLPSGAEAGNETLQTPGDATPPWLGGIPGMIFPNLGSFGDNVLGGLTQVLVGGVIDNIGLGLDNPFTEGQQFTGFPNSIPNVLGFPDPADIFASVVNPPAPVAPVTDIGAMPVNQLTPRLPDIITPAQWAQLSAAGVDLNGRYVARSGVLVRKKTRQKKCLRKCQMDAMLFGKQVLGNGANYGIFLAKILG